MSNHTRETESAIRARAQELSQQRGGLPGHEVEDWLQAEAEVLALKPTQAESKRAVVVKVAGVTYTGEYDPKHCRGYTPGELSAGQPLRVRFQDDRMFIARPDGLELEARVIRTVSPKHQPSR